MTAMAIAAEPTTRTRSPRRLYERLDEDACWQAVVDRRAASRDLFVIAVTSTKIYCRPGCPSRMPLRKNVRFYVSPDDAERAGFRACKRCRPRDPVRADVTLVQRICRELEQSGERAPVTASVRAVPVTASVRAVPVTASVRAAPVTTSVRGIPTLDALSQRFGVSAFHLQRTFKRITGLSPRRYAELHRSEKLKRGLREGDGIAAATYGAGLGSSSRLYERANGITGMTPARYQRGGEGMRIAYTVTSCMFGRLLVGATERGVSAVSFSDSDERLVAALEREYPAAEIARDDASMRPWVEKVLRSVDGGATQPDLPLDIRGTAFRARVWDALRAIPRGETRTYGEIARAIGSPSAARAVGNACHNNPVAVIIPCHRVVRGDGDIGGYGGGVENKRKLLERERGGG